MGRVSLLTFVVCLLAGQACADITLPYDTNPYGTYQKWTFATAPADFSHIVPEVDLNPYGAPYADVSAEGEDPLPAVGPMWVSASKSWPTRTGFVYASPIERVGLWIPNEPLPLIKYVQAEFEYYVQPGGGYMESWLDPGDEGGPIVDPVSVEEVLGADGWYDLTLNFTFPQIEADPGEWIWVKLHDSGVFLDTVEVATICVPVPAAILVGLLGLAVAGLKLRKFA